jgi:hypothetical protein
MVSDASSASSEEEQGGDEGAEASSEEEDEYSDSEAEAEIWRQHLEARQAAIMGAVQTAPSSRRTPTMVNPSTSKSASAVAAVAAAKVRAQANEAVESNDDVADSLRDLHQVIPLTLLCYGMG